jgi:hypothetical protein
MRGKSGDILQCRCISLHLRAVVHHVDAEANRVLLQRQRRRFLGRALEFCGNVTGKEVKQIKLLHQTKSLRVRHAPTKAASRAPLSSRSARVAARGVKVFEMAGEGEETGGRNEAICSGWVLIVAAASTGD